MDQSHIMLSKAIKPAKSVPDPMLVLIASLLPDAEAAGPVDEAVSDPLLALDSELPESDADVTDGDPVEVAVADVVEGVILGPGPAVIMSPFPPGYTPPPAAVKSCGTCV